MDKDIVKPAMDCQRMGTLIALYDEQGRIAQRSKFILMSYLMFLILDLNLDFILLILHFAHFFFEILTFFTILETAKFFLFFFFFF